MVILAIILVLAALVAVLWLGLQVKPAPFPPYPASTPPLATVPLPAGLPAPVERYAHAALGEQIPVIRSAVITGGGKLTFQGITFNSRWRFVHDCGSGYRHYIEATIFGRPLFRVNEWFLDGTGRMELPFGLIGEGAKINTAAALGLWSEGVWTPAIYFTDPRVRWEAIDATHARLIVPSGAGEDSFTVTFDAQSGLISQLESLRWRDEKDAQKLRWTNVIVRWQALNGVQVPALAQVIWSDQRAPWFVPAVEEIVYNVDVTDYIRGRGL